MNSESGVVFGALALKSGAIDAMQFLEACAACRADPRTPLADWLQARGWISPAQRAELDRALIQATGATLAHSHGAEAPTLADPRTTVGIGTRAGMVDDALLPTVDHASRPDHPTNGSHGETTVAMDAGPHRVSPLGSSGEPTERYTRTRLHARGGIGQVWLARDDSLGREVALKELRPDRVADGASWSRFLEEARVTGQLEHPGIVPIYELGDEKGRNPFYTMRFVRGKTLGEAIHEYHQRCGKGTAGPLELASLLNAFVGVCNAVAYAHSRGVVHRDLKGQNVVLGDFGEVMVLDWGLAKHVAGADGGASPAGPAVATDEDTAAAAEATQHGQVLGTPAYMAPEQAAGEIDRIGPRTDVYALGAILYEILTGRPPFRAEKMTELLRQVREDAPIRPRAVEPSTSPALEAICLKAMAKAPEARYPLASDVAAEVRRWLADEPVRAYPEPWTRRLARWARRHRSAVAAAAAVLVLGAGALGVSSVIVRRERDIARTQREIARGAVNDMYTGVAEDWLEDYLDPLQQEFLERALGYYRRFAGPMAGQPSVRKETALALTRVGDIHRKLGRDAEAEQSYREAMRHFDALAAAGPLGPAEVRHRARLRTRLGALLAAVGRHDEARPLLKQARDDQQAILGPEPHDPQAAYLLARTCREQANLLRTVRDNPAAQEAYDRAAALLEPAVAADPSLVEPRRELGTVLARRGQLQTELGHSADAEASFRRGLEILGPLLAEFPTNPRIREGLADTLDSLGRLLRSKPGASAEAETRLKLAVEHYRRLAEDFPGRPEYGRLLSRGWVNLGSLYVTTGRPAAAEPAYRQAVETLRTLRERIPDEPKVHRDLGIALNNLGSTLRGTGRGADAVDAFRRAIEVQEDLARRHPDVPDYQSYLAGDLLNLGIALAESGDATGADDAYRRAQPLLEALVAKHPDMPDYRVELARLLGLRGVLLSAEEPARAEPLFRAAVESYDRLLADQPEDTSLRAALADCLTNFAELRIDGRRLADARALDERAVALYRELARDAPDDAAVQLNLATVLVNLGECLVDLDQKDQADGPYTESSAIFDRLAAGTDPPPEVHQRFAYLLTNQGKLALAAATADLARQRLDRAIAEQRAYLKAVRQPASSSAELREEMNLLARAIVAEGQHREAAAVAVEIPRQAPSRPEARVDAARLLARCASLARTDARLAEAERSPLARLYADRAVAQLRVAIDSGYRQHQSLGDDPDFAPLRDRPDFQGLLAVTQDRPEAE